MRKTSKGKASLAALTTPSTTIPRLPAPYSLTDKEVEVWERIANSMPADHFAPGNASVLAQLCRHIAASDKVAMLVETIARKKPFDADAFAAMLRSQVAESVIINRLSRSMRLTQQALYRGELVRNRPINDTPPPWIRADDDETSPDLSERKSV